MPWKIIPNETGQFCVHKLDADGNPTELVTCHPTMEAAEAHIRALYANEPDTETAGKHLVTIKALNDQGRIGGYLVVWGSPAQKDLQGEYFTPDTELGLDWYDRRPVLYHHGLDSDLKASVVGVIDHLKTDSIGVWAEAQLDMRHKYIQALQRLVKQGALGWSSGSLSHLVEVADDGHIRRWPIVEGSMTPAPAEPRHTDINFIKSVYAELGLDIQKLIPAETEATADAKEPEAKERETARKDNGVTFETETEVETTMNLLDMIKEFLTALIAQGVAIPQDQVETLAQQVASVIQPEAAMQTAAVPADQVAATLAQVQPAVMKAVAGYVAARKAQSDAISAAASEAVKAMRQTPPVNPLPAFTGNGNSGVQQQPVAEPEQHRIEVVAKYASLSPLDMSYLAILRKGATRGQWLGEPEFYKELADRAGKAIEAGQLATTPEISRAIKAVKSGEWKGLGMKANTLDHSTQTGYGDEWVPDLWSSDLWRRARMENVVLPLFRVVEMPANPFEIPAEGADPTVYYVPETTDESELTVSGAGAAIPDSKIGTGKVTLTAKKLALRVGFSSELEEDSIIPLISIFREQADRAIKDSIDYVLLNGDDTTTATGNINSDDAAPAATDRYLAFNGLLHSALVEDTSRRLDALGVSPSLQLIRATRFKMPYAYANRPGDIAYIVGGEVYHKLLNIDEFLTVDKYGPNATVITGEIGKIDGSPVLTSAQLAAAEADGFINTASPSSTLYGRLLTVYKPNWYVGYRRQVKVDVSYIPYYDAYQLTATVRLAFAHFDNDSASVLYDLAI